MKLSRFKGIRIIVSLLFFFLIVFLYLDFRNLYPGAFSNIVLYLQFIPSLLKFISVLAVSTVGFIIVILITIVIGRVYCSTICPLGTFQDIITYLSRRFKMKKRHYYSKPHNILRYSILVLAIGSFIYGSLILINLLDPYSTFGRIFNHLFQPIVIGVNNLITLILKFFDIYAIYPYEIKGFGLEYLIVPVIFLVLILILAAYKGRMYCNTVCPVGTLFGFLSKFSIFRIYINLDTCTKCNLCEVVCKSNCIDYKTMRVDMSRCVSCFNCFKVCASSSLEYKYGYNTIKNKASKPDYVKRAFLWSSFIGFMGLTGFKADPEKPLPKVQGSIPAFTANPVTPPGSISIDHFKSACLACNLCVSACPTQVLQPTLFEYGISGVLQPKMNYHVGYCDYKCNICSQICPSGAILSITGQEKKKIQMGKAKVMKDSCIVYTDHTDCGACAEPCPTKAVKMIPYNVLFVPNVDDEICTGCGACEFACPTKPYKAIYVEANTTHKVAKEPEIIEEKEEVDYEEDFPF